MEEYSNYLRHIFRDYTVLFVGYSFRDPDINLFLEYFKKHLALPGEGHAYALLSENDESIASTLRDVSIKPLVVAGGGGHTLVWEEIRKLAQQVRAACGMEWVRAETESERERELVLRSLSAVYAHHKIRQEQRITDTVLAGLTLGAISQLTIEGGECQTADVEHRVARVFYFDVNTVAPLVARALVQLEAAGTISRRESTVRLHKYEEHALREDTAFLVRRLRDRAEVRYNTEIPADTNVEAFLLRVMIVRGLAVAHAMVRRRPVESEGLDATLVAAFSACFGDEASAWREPLLAATRSFLSSPTQDEEPRLASFARLVMMTDVVLNAPTLETMAGVADVSKIFLDANILMPAIVAYNPNHETYNQILQAARERGTGLVSTTAFLNEIVSHRERAVEAYKVGGFEDRETFVRYVRLFGSGGINAYLGAYAGWLSDGADQDFEVFLEEYAPYATETQLADYVERRGITIVDLTFDQDIELGRIARWESALSDQYRKRRHKKARTLVWHEARQIEALLISDSRHEASWFMTADRKFIRAVSDIIDEGHHLLPPRVLQSIMTPVQLGGYLDLISERQIDWTGYSSLVWTQAYQSFHERFSEFAIDRVLQEYEAALTLSIPSILDACRAELGKESLLDQEPDDTTEQGRIRQFRLIEEFEPRFYELMAEEKRKRGLI